jgi:SAM-dependent methyltransferase
LQGYLAAPHFIVEVSLKPIDLPRLGIIKHTDLDIVNLFNRYGNPVTGANVLCVGYSEAELVPMVEIHQPKSITCLTNWESHEDAAVNKHKLIVGDLCARTPFPEHHFDSVLLMAVFEHLHDLPGALAELKRITRPGGHVVSLFGPTWSCAYGHHLYADDADPNLNFAAWQLPAHFHLLSTFEEIREWYASMGYDKSVSEVVLDCLYRTPMINRLFFDDYMRMIRDEFQIVAMELMFNDLPADHLKLLRAKFPGYMDFSTYGGKFLLRVPPLVS